MTEQLLYITFSRILEKVGSKDIGLQFNMTVLSPFLRIGVILEYFKREGNIPVDRDLLLIYANGDDINGVLAFINLVVIPSYP